MSVNRIYIITGEKGEGKTTLLEHVVQCMRLQGYHLGGFLSKGFWKGNERSHFELWDIEKDQGLMLCKRDPSEGWPQWGPFFFNPEALAKASQIIDRCLLEKPDLVVMDEIGKFELADGGFHKLIKKLMQNLIYPQLWVVRRPFVSEIMEKYRIQKISIFDATNSNAPQICREIADQLSELK